ncbi:MULTISPECIES: sensor histidine kinase [Pseudoalteromonas]|uniref:sensor histidine kinase n=1 Tax=Pseudoalteromonas TaxID=53246 RepID=UPI002359A57A|nr:MULTISPECIES: HAMP domain-containing sensor histidine kinase [Pseudoalteromonas]MDC9566340.1 HAMP domain-containing sensor histidine kinase [Pseudoalteromonas sp. GAB2316C]MDC9570613.1 HAMP domain-containing sensor histidine kinase [Pseudoalteromonas sp. GABNB9D]MDC9574810.1 HAMP domain-containing sensor histidine kinase [Pseudoalteromonas sp. GABNS16A]MDC9579122.1 HAMP domain-containing sensor histidine kinase [Pseudoalteromonas sp. GABNS16E]MDC9586835.1 HAMP domain-containing sensor histi
MMKSIRSKLVITLSVTITGLVLCILLATDIAVDSWIDNEFDRSLQSKAGMLKTLVNKTDNGYSYNFSSEFMPEFAGEVEPEYFQIWNKEGTSIRSKSLDLFEVKNLPFENLEIGESKIRPIQLPDGRDGRIFYSRFIPQVKDKASVDTSKKTDAESMILAYTASSEEVDFVLWLIDVIFIVTTITVIVFIRLFVRKAIDTSLAPLVQLNKDISQLSIVSEGSEIFIKEPVKELLPIVESLNAFIKENRQLYLREKRLTSDIAHEIKTPIAELINMAEVSIRFPNEKELNDDFKPEALKISLRLKNIVSNLLLLHKYGGGKLNKRDACDLNQVISRILETHDLSRVNLQLDENAPAIMSNLFALESIFSNLVNNAKQYSPLDSKILVSTRVVRDKNLILSVTNSLNEPLNASDIDQLFDPLWQKDISRTSIDNFGLGLSIAKTLSKAIDAQLSAKVSDKKITFFLVLNKD